MRERERVKRYLALLLAFTMIFTSSSMNVLAATVVGGYKNSNKSQITTEESETSVETEAQETQVPETEETDAGIRKNIVTFFTNGHAHVVVDGETVDSTAYAKDGKIVFDVAVENGYQIESVLVDKSINARTTENGSYIIEGIQTDNTTVDITTVEAETEAQTEAMTETEELTETEAITETESESESESETESETETSEETEISKPAQKLTVTAADGARITVNAPEGALPEGSSVRAIVVESRAIETVLENTIESEGKELSSYKAYDITIIGPDGATIQPDDSVTVSIRNAGVDGEENAVYHVDGASADKIADVANGNNASFEAEHFSIYVITGENKPAIATYEFYEFDDSEDPISSQSVKDGEKLIEPAAPEHDGQYFTGWFVKGTTTPVTFSTPVSVSETGTVKVVAKYENAYYVFFKNNSGIVICTKEGRTGDTISTSDVTFPVSGNQGITGWYEDEALTKKVEVVTLANKDVVLYPKVEDGYYITYQGNGGSYTAPVFMLPTENTTAPNAPTKPGYTFKYWSLTENGSEYKFGEKLTESITLYAVWEAKDTSYLIMYWMENANYENLHLTEDKRDMEQYSYAASATGKGKTGEKTNVSGWNGKIPAGFTIQKIEQQTIAGDGSTVVNVYMNRNTYTVTFMKSQGWGWNKDWNEDTTLRITAKYGANIESKWPGNNWRTSQNGSTYQSHLFTMPLNGATFYKANDGGKISSAEYYVQALPGETGTIKENGKKYKLHHTDNSYGTDFTVTEEDRYDMEGYTCNRNLSPRNGASWGGSKFYYDRNQYDIIFINEGTKVDEVSKYFEQSLTGVSCSKELTPPAGKENYVFAGWYDNPEGEGSEYTFTGRIMPAKNITVYAKWVAPTFNVRVYSTMDASEDESTVYEKALGSKLSSDELAVTVPTGHTFRGWYLYENGQRTALYNPDTEIHGDIALVPYWTSDETFKVSYNAGDKGEGTVTDALEYAEDAKAKVKSASDLTAKEAGYYFQGWLSDTDHKTYYPGDEYIIKGNVTFTAQWGKEQKATVSYDPGTGIGKSQSFDVANNAEIVTKTPEALGFKAQDGYTFVGWSYTNSDGITVIADAGVTVHVDTKTTPSNTLTAQWAKLNAVGGTWTYDGQSHTVSGVGVDGVDGYAFTYKVGDTVCTDLTSIAIINVGEKSVTVIATKAGYRTLEKTVTLKIIPAEVTVTVVGNKDSRVYNGTVQSVNGYSISSNNTLYSVTDMVSGPTQESAIARRKDVGTTYMGLSKDSFTNVNTNFKVTFAVTDGYITITAKDISKEGNAEVDTPVDVTYDGQDHKWTPTVKDMETKEVLVKDLDYTVSYDTKDFVDVKTIKVTITGKGNYTGTVTRVYRITPAPVTITTDSDNKVYDGTPLTAGGKIEGIVEGEKVNFNVTGSQTEVGSSKNTYTLAWDTAKESNYEIIKEEIGTLTITAQSIDPGNPDYRDISIDKPENKVYDGKQHKWTPTVTGKDGKTLKEGTDYTVSYDKDNFVDVKTINVTITGKGNYTGTVTRVYSITPAPVTITTDSDSKVYDGTALTAGGRVTGLVNGETVSFVTTGSQKEVGSSDNTYTLTWNQTAKESNYEIIKEEIGTLAVTENTNEIVVTTTGGTFGYDGQSHGAKVSVSALPEGYTLKEASSNASAIDVTDADGVTATADILVIVNQKGEDVTKKLNIKKLDGTIKVTPATVTIITQSATKVYDGTPLTAGGTMTGLVNGETAYFQITGSQTDVGAKMNVYSTMWSVPGMPYTAKRSNYTIKENMGILKVTAQSIVPDPEKPESYLGIKISNPQDHVYDGQEHRWTPTVTDKDGKLLVEGTDYTVSYNEPEEGTEAFKDVQTITVTIRGTGNYTGKATRTYHITPASVTITTDSDSKVYDGTALTAGGTVTGLAKGETVGFKTTGSQTEAGFSDNTYEIAWAGEEMQDSDKELVPYTAKKSNYTVKETLGKLTVTAQSIEPDDPSYMGIQIDDPSDHVYDAQEHKWIPTVTDKEGNKLIEGTDYTVSYDTENFVDVKTITVTITGKGNYSGTVVKTYQITPREVTILTYTDSKVYDGNALTAGGEINGLVEGETVGFVTTGSQTEVGFSDNTYEITWAGEEVQDSDKELVPYTAKKSNYTVKDTIGKLTVTAQSIDPDDPDYNGISIDSPEDKVYDGKLHKWTPTVTDKDGKPLTEGTDYTVSYNDPAEGTEAFKDVQTITVTITGTGNYTGSVTRIYHITPALVTITTDSDSKVYDGTTLTAGGRIEGIVDGEEVSFKVTGSQTEVGFSDNTYTLTWDNAKESNYTIVETNVGTLTVTESEEEIVVTTTGGTFVYNGQSHGATVSVSDLPKGYTLKAAASSASATDVTETDVKATADTLVIVNQEGKDVTDKLNITRHDGIIKVTPATLTVTTPDASKVYDGTALTAEGTVAGLVEGETVGFKTTGSQTEVGFSDNTYEITWAGEEVQDSDKELVPYTAKKSNYTVEDNVGILTVKAQSIEPEDPDYKGISIDSPEDKVYDGKLHKWTPTVTDKDGNTLTEGTDYTVSYNDPAEGTEAFKDVQTITVTITGTGNYTGSVTRTYHITPASVTITTDSDSKVYDGTALTADGTVTGLVEGETVGFVTTGSQTYVGSSDNTYEITWAQEEVEVQASDEESTSFTAKKSNYTVSENIGTLTVTDGTEEEPVDPNLVVKKNDEQADGYEYKLGETVRFTISVTNIYDETKNVTITELAGVVIEGAEAGTPNVLVKTNVAPGETVTATATYTITEEDVANGFFRNTVKAAFDGGKTFENEKTVDTEEAVRSYSLSKTSSKSTHESGMFKVGETIHYTITAVNTGNQTIKNLQIEDTLKAAGMISNITGDGVTCTQNGNVTTFTIAELSAGAEPVVIEYDYLVQEADKGSVISNAIIGKDPEDPEKPGEGGGTENTVEDPKLEVTKSVVSIAAEDGTAKEVTGKASLNDVITYQVTVKNTGNIRLMNVKLADSLEDIVLAENDSFDIGTLDVGEEKSVTYTYTVKAADLGSTIVNVATATGDVPEDPEDTPKPSGEDKKEVPTDEKSSAIQVTKTVTSKGSTITVDGKETTGYRVGDTIEFNIHVENMGNITVNNIVVNDVPTLSTGSPKGNITIVASEDGKYTVDGSTATIATLEPEASVDIRASYLVIAGDGTTKGNELINTAFATGTSEDPNNPQPGDSSKTDPLPIEPEPDGHPEMQGSITVTKMITTSANKTPETGVDAVIKVGLYDNASFSGTPIAVNTITISKATSGTTVFDELDNTFNTTYYVAELDANNNPIIGISAHLDGYGVPSYSENCKSGINPTTADNTSATIVNPLAGDDNQDETEETEETEVTTEKETTSTDKTSDNSKPSTKSSTAAKTGDDTNMMVYWMILGMAALSGCTAVVYRKKRKKQ